MDRVTLRGGEGDTFYNNNVIVYNLYTVLCLIGQLAYTTLTNQNFTFTSSIDSIRQLGIT